MFVLHHMQDVTRTDSLGILEVLHMGSSIVHKRLLYLGQLEQAHSSVSHLGSCSISHKQAQLQASRTCSYVLALFTWQSRKEMQCRASAASMILHAQHT